MNECKNCGAPPQTSRETCSRECQDIVDLPLTDEEIAQREADSERVCDGIDKVKEGLQDSRQGLGFGKKK